MNLKRLPVWLIASVFIGNIAIGSQDDDARMRRVAALELADLMAQNYVYPDIAYRYATHLRERSGLLWWLRQAVDLTDLAATFTPFSSFNVGTVLVQWGIALAVFLSLNRWLAGSPAEPSE